MFPRLRQIVSCHAALITDDRHALADVANAFHPTSSVSSANLESLQPILSQHVVSVPLSSKMNGMKTVVKKLAVKASKKGIDLGLRTRVEREREREN